MKRFIGLTIGLFFVIGFVSLAEAITINVAEVQNGLAVVQGSKAAKSAAITWDGVSVTQTTKGGSFSFSATVPADCVGTLSDGVSTIDVALLDCPQVSATPAPVPQTGQTTSYAAGDDGALQKGVILPTPRFTDHNNGTITDNLTGLIWLKNASCPPVGTIDWPTAIAYVASLNSNGTMNGNNCGDTSNGGSHQTDWRLPNVRELLSLIDWGFNNPALSNAAGTGQATLNDPFMNFAAPISFWSSTSVVTSPNFVFLVSLGDGSVGVSNKIGNGLVLAVRGGL